MPTYLITAPDGTKYRVTGDGTQDEALAHVQSQAGEQPSAVQSLQDFVKSNRGEYDPSSAEYQAKYGPTSGSSFGQNALEGAGKAFVDLGRGVGQKLGLVSNEDVQASRDRDAELMKTAGGVMGNIAGNVAATVPALAIPGANTVAGATAIGAGLGFLQPATSRREVAANTWVGGLTGGAGQYVGGKVADAVTSKLASRTAAANVEKSLNSARDAVLNDSRAAGYVIPPTAVNPSMTATALESVSGKAATRQAAQAVNARVTNRLVATDLGLPVDRPITQAALAGVRQRAGQVYGAVAKSGPVLADAPYLAELQRIGQAGTNLSTAYPGIGAQANAEVQDLVKSLASAQVDANDAVAAFRFLNERAKANFASAFQKGGNQQALELGRAQRDAADALGDLIQRNLDQNTGSKALSQAWQKARVLIAKSYTAEAALKGGNVNAAQLARQLQKGKPLSGGFKTAAQFGDMFEDVAKAPKSGVGVSKLAATVASLGPAAYLLGHPAAAVAALGTAAAPYVVRGGLMSKIGQRALATPNYVPNRAATAALTGAGTLGRYGMLPAYLAGEQLVQAQQQDAP